MLKFITMAMLHSILGKTAAAAPQDYILNPGKGLLYIMVFKDESTAAAALSHNHAIKAVGWSGLVAWDPEQASACSISMTVPVNNLQVDMEEVRVLAGLERDITVSQREEVKRNMLSDSQLWFQKYPEIKFVSSACESKGDKIILKGKFTLRGQTNDISLPIKVTTENGIKIEGNFRFKGSDYGLEPYSAMFGQLRNMDEMEVRLNLIGSAK
jgi:polyisoprenoid-binding protein YceI